MIEAGGSDPDHDGLPGTGSVLVDNTGAVIGIPASFGNIDTDKDGIIDELDLDSDNDGLYDIIENGGIDADTNGVADDLKDANGSVDADNDGIPNAVDADFPTGKPLNIINSDNDTLPDYKDIDSDNDGLVDLVESGGVDRDHNGVGDSNSDIDNDGILDIFDHINNSTGAVTPGTPSLNIDTDNDGVINKLDLDSDNDGISDIKESFGIDPNNDGVAGSQTMITALEDADNDGLIDVVDPSEGGIAVLPVNSDSDNLPNYLDIDSDNDGITDIYEATLGTKDTDKNGVLMSKDSNKNGIDDSLESDLTDASKNVITFINPINSDTDTLPDYLDIDADNDGIVDIIEAQSTESYTAPSEKDVNNNGLDDIFETSTTKGLQPVDTDNDKTSDYLDLDSDNDSKSDNQEANGSAKTLSGSDKDKDGLDDIFDKDSGVDNSSGSTNNQSVTSLANNDTPFTDERDFRELPFAIPDAITPNGDGINDNFVIQVDYNANDVKLIVFNRWGNTVYENEKYDNSWNGTTNKGVSIGTDLPTGTYFYLVEINNTKKQGYVVITR